MNPRDLPEVVAELITEMPEVRSELKEAHAVLRGIHTAQRAMREDMQTLPDRTGAAMFKSLEPFLNRLLAHDDHLKNHKNWLGSLANLT